MSEIFEMGFGAISTMMAASGKEMSFEQFKEHCLAANKIMSGDDYGLLNEEEIEEAINLSWTNVKGTNG